MKLIIAGSRTLDHENPFIRKAILRHLDNTFDKEDVSEVVCGGARGPDSIGRIWANTYRIPIKEFPAKWDEFGKKAGPIRNQEMADYADGAIIYWDGMSRGSVDMFTRAKRKTGRPVKMVRMVLVPAEDTYDWIWDDGKQ